MMKNKHLTRERNTVSKMIGIYCKANHSPYNGHLCIDCRSLEVYARQRIECCPLRSTLRVGEGKPTCAKCPVHCYKPGMREKIRQVMRFAGPRMLFHHPILSILHLIDGLRKPPPA